MKYALTVDGGNSKTIAIVADQTGKLLSLSRRGGCNYQSIGRKAAKNVLADVIGSAVKDAGVKKIAAACYGLAGADREKDFQVFREILKPIDPSEKSALVNDTVLALRAGAKDGVGVALIGGAGSNCIGMDKKGRIRKAWGLGPLTGDKANAGALVQDAVVESMKSLDGRGPETLLAESFRTALELDALEDVIEFEFADEMRGLHVARLAPLIFEAANQGDRVAINILKDHGRAAGEAALAVLRDLFKPSQKVTLVLGGSVLQKGSNPALVKAIEQTVIKEFPKLEMVRLKDPPVLGGVLRALDELDKKAAEKARPAIKKGLAKYQDEIENRAEE